ncbi:crotonase/enoyl-CoA hydratase family protein [Novosphingopyxis baekryungensis]|jgi:DSF synthase|uniref:crotonase/enoyl-CoA hydratase family protein n=1 Tax=Novosphingopyxis baekryungensis TaxID=279369 RepID=UPI0003B523F1|nr:crotonase/enoyl-CoA hydratase family protein [Novosphingopyxis baekryungensis]
MVLHAHIANDHTPSGIAEMDSDIFSRDFKEISLRHDVEDGIFWCHMNQKGRPSYTYALGAEIQQVHDWVERRSAFVDQGPSDDLRYFVSASKTPGVFNLGGDLRHFAEKIMTRDLPAMRAYAETCVRMQYAHATGFGAPVITMALVQGDALGGGFEHALAFDVLVAERSARFGLPEIVFNLFPGMGAYSFLLRRVGRKVTEELILGGKIMSAEDLHEMGIVDILVDDGAGEAAIIDYTRKHRARFHAERAVYAARKAANPVSLDELLDITNIWAETAMQLSDSDVRKMQRLANAQEHRMARQRPRAL